MKADTHTLLLDAALFGAPTPTCGGPHADSAAAPADQSTANWEQASELTEGVSARKPAWTAE